MVERLHVNCFPVAAAKGISVVPCNINETNANKKHCLSDMEGQEAFDTHLKG